MAHNIATTFYNFSYQQNRFVVLFKSSKIPPFFLLIFHSILSSFLSTTISKWLEFFVAVISFDIRKYFEITRLSICAIIVKRQKSVENVALGFILMLICYFFLVSLALCKYIKVRKYVTFAQSNCTKMSAKCIMSEIAKGFFYYYFFLI